MEWTQFIAHVIVYFSERFQGNHLIHRICNGKITYRVPNTKFIGRFPAQQHPRNFNKKFYQVFGVKNTYVFRFHVLCELFDVGFAFMPNQLTSIFYASVHSHPKLSS